MTSLATALSFAGIILLSTYKPGPGFIATLSRALADGWKQGVVMALGNASMHVVFFVLVCLTFSFAADWVVFLTFLLKAVGAAFMIYLGIKEFIKNDTPIPTQSTVVHTQQYWQNYMAGVAICAANPLVIFLYAALVPTFVNVQQLDLQQIVIFSFIILAMNGGGLGVLCLAAGRVRRFFENTNNLRFVRYGVGSIFIIIGLVIGLSGLPIIDWVNLYF